MSSDKVKIISHTLWTHDSGTALVIGLFDDTILSNWFDEGANVEVAHEHLIGAGAVQARLVRLDLFSLSVVLILIVASCKKIDHHRMQTPNQT